MLVYLITDTGACYIAHTNSIEKLITDSCVIIVKIVDEKGVVIYES